MRVGRVGGVDPWWSARRRSCSAVAVPRRAAARDLERLLRSFTCQAGSLADVVGRAAVVGSAALAGAQWACEGWGTDLQPKSLLLEPKWLRSMCKYVNVQMYIGEI